MNKFIIFILLIALANFIFVIKVNYNYQQNKIYQLEDRLEALEDLYWNNLGKRI